MTQHHDISTVTPSAIIERAHLSRALDYVKNVVEKKNRIPALAAVRVTGTGTAATFTATDLDTQVTVTAPCPADSRLDMALNAHNLADMSKKAKASDVVEIKAGSEGGAVLDFEGLRVTMPAACDLVDVPTGVIQPWEPDNQHAFTLSLAKLRRALTRCEFAISTEETRYYLGGIYMHAHDDGLRFVATDGHRLARQTVTRPDGAGNIPGVILPRKLVKLLITACKDKAAPDDVTVQVRDTAVAFTFGDVRFDAKVIDGNFPDYGRVVPCDTLVEHHTRFDKAALADAVKQVSVISNDRGRAVKFTIGECEIMAEVDNPNAGRAEMGLPCEYRHKGKDSECTGYTIGFNSRYVLEILATIPGDTITMHGEDAGAPHLFTCEDPDFIVVLMPMRV